MKQLATRKGLKTEESRRASHRVLARGLLLMIIDVAVRSLQNAVTVTLVTETISSSSHIQS
jgi:hypothetical protein